MKNERFKTMRLSRRPLFLGLAVGLLAMTAVLFPACSRHPDATGAAPAGKVLYHCAMHPQIVSDKPGECPICHMQLSPFSPNDRGQTKIIYYRNPMNPSATSPVPMKDSMGMPYIPVYSNDNTESAPVPGQAVVHLTPGVEQHIGVTVAAASEQDLVIPIRAAARVAYDPQLYSATIEHQEAAALLRKAKTRGSDDLAEQAASTLRSSALRLRQMGLSDEQIAEIEKPGYDSSGLLVASKGSAVWVYASVSDNEADLIQSGQRVELTSPARPGAVYEGTVRSLDPILNSDTRTLRVRIEIPRPRGDLRPETYMSATIQATLKRRLVVPESALVDTGTRQLVYVQSAPGTYEPRQVRVGHRAGGYDEIVSGLHPGEVVATSSNFLLDSESRIQASAQEVTQHLHE